MMQISVIIPVYNAAPFLVKAVESALNQEETAEVLLIEDCSTDNSLDICQQLKKQYEKVKLFRHPDGKNHGAGASRNLGIENAKYEFVAFLDADDYYLLGRFEKDREILMGDETIDGVYNALGSFFYSQDEHILEDFKGREFTTMTKRVSPENLFDELSPIGNKGYFHLDTLTIRKSAFQKAGKFNTQLRVTQDTDILIRLAAACRLAPGNIENAIAIRGVHENNRSNPKELRKYQYQLYRSLFDWAVKNRIPHLRICRLYELFYAQHAKAIFHYPFLRRRIAQAIFLIKSVVKYPGVIPGFVWQKIQPKAFSSNQQQKQ